MDNRKIATSSLVLLFLINICYGDKLTTDQKAPLNALNSGGLLLTAPLVGNGAADVGRRTDVGRSGGSSKPTPPKQNNQTPQVQSQEDGVTREETEELKEIDGQLVRIVKGSLGYDSPEGLPVSIKYTADENGNRASFTIGKPGTGGNTNAAGGSKGSGTSSNGGGGGKNNNNAGGDGGEGKKTGGSGNGPSTYLPPTMMKVDKTYLPPS